MGKFDISIVIPSYDEGRDIDRSLVRIATLAEKLSKRIKVAVFIVINNSSGASSQVKRNNAKTSTLLQEIKENRENDNIKKRGKRDTKILQYLTRSKVQFIEVDLFRSGSAPKVCNVGIARGAGFREASNQTAKNGVMIGTDADTLLGKDYIKQALKLRHERRYGALTGPVRVYRENVNMNNDREVVDFIEALWLEAIGAENIEGVWLDPQRSYVPHIPGSNLVVQNRVFKAVGTFPEVSGAEDVLFGMQVNMLGEGIDFDENLSVYTSPRISLRTPKGHGFGQMIDVKDRSLHDIDVPYLPTEKYAFAVQEIAIFLRRNRIDWYTKEKWIKSFTTLLDGLKITVDKGKIEKWHAMLSEFTDFTGNFPHPLVKAELIDEVEKIFPRISLTDAAKKVIRSSPHVAEEEKKNLLHVLIKAKELDLGSFGVRFILLYLKIVDKIEQLEHVIKINHDKLEECDSVFDYKKYFKIHKQLIENMLCVLLCTYEAMLGFKHKRKVQQTKENSIGIVAQMKKDAQENLVNIDNIHIVGVIKNLQERILEIDLLFPKLYFNVE